ncbi:MAG: hypothetical protein EXR77_15680 [Myxococcales bacterium]|nr:hypothetical protein [Myxococcales bacterium]
MPIIPAQSEIAPRLPTPLTVPITAELDLGEVSDATTAPLSKAPHGPPAASEITAIFGSQVPFVGRRRDLEIIYNAVREGLNKKSLGVVWVSGPKGCGKTRLYAELHRAVAPGSRGMMWARLTEIPGIGPPSLAGEVLLEVLGGVGLLRQADAWAQVHLRLQGWLGADRAADASQLVAPMLGLRGSVAGEEYGAVEPPLQVACQLVAAILRHCARQSPLIVQINADRCNEGEIEALVAGLRLSPVNGPMAVLFESHRQPPEGLQATTLTLEPIDNPALAALARKLLKKVHGAPPSLPEQLASGAGGSPERLLDSLRGMLAGQDVVFREGSWRWQHRTERGVSASWQNTLAAAGQGKNGLPDRIARLPQDLRIVADAAAVFGATCWFGGVLSVLRGGKNDGVDSLTERDRSALKGAMLQLQAVDVIVFVEESRLGREIEFSFVHPTDPAAVVGEMDHEKRSLFSRLAAQWFASRPHQDPVGDNARIAELFEQGGRGRQAAQHYLEAGNAARTVGQLQRAIALYAAGSRNAASDDADVACDLRIAHGGGLLRLSRIAEAEKVLLDAMHMARCLDDDQRCGIVQLRIAQVARVSGRYEAAFANLDAAAKHLKVVGAHRWIADVSDEMGMIHLIRGEQNAYKNALQLFLKALALRRRSQDRRVVARSLCNIARVHLGRGHFHDALDAVAEANQICDQIQERWGAAEARVVLGEVHAAQGKYKLAFQTWDQAFQLSGEVGDRHRKLEVALMRAETAITVGEWHEASAMMMNVAELAREVDDPELNSGFYRVQASISLERNALETADLDSERAVDVARSSGARLAVARALIVRACVLGTRALSEGGARATAIDRKATESFEEGMTMLREMGDLVRLSAGLRSFVAYLNQRGGGPRLAAVQSRLADVEAEMAAVAG